ncbi:pirin family protein [Limnoraphis robusta]|uniref:Quercetin 2,3-dioxygenase n=1 Tax=Limnoraphis robusta CS-951 TaxID=1637645 RepID=A0A0F5YAC6_9CYAN|nr:pirin family protein [Limnoraphis robusta]KKD35567.1 quercetin 2,3-dioxygenase [Limnoraphis robusta CS-951]
MITLRKSTERGQANFGWLNSYHTFSFGNYYDPKHMGFRALRVINEDRVSPGAGFDTHGHRDMEILTYVLEGSLEHQDSTGTSAIIHRGEVQRMSAGTGILHSEFNASKTEPAHFVQIWILPNQIGLPPSYEQKAFNLLETPGQFKQIAASNPQNGSLKIHQDVNLSAAILSKSERLFYDLAPQRHAWVQVLRGELLVNDITLKSGDGLAISDQSQIALEATEEAEILLFDLA